MRIHIDHATTYAYDRAARFIIQSLRLTPRSSEAQQVRHWRVETDVDARLRRSEDAFGNIVHTLYTEQPTQSLTVRVSGEVATSDTGGVVPPDQETLSPVVFLRDTALTRRDKLISVFASEFSAHPPLERLHRLMAGIHGSVAFEVGVTTPTSKATEPWIAVISRCIRSSGGWAENSEANTEINFSRFVSGVSRRNTTGDSVSWSGGTTPPVSLVITSPETRTVRLCVGCSV